MVVMNKIIERRKYRKILGKGCLQKDFTSPRLKRNSDVSAKRFVYRARVRQHRIRKAVPSL